MQSRGRQFFPLIILFIILNAFFLTQRSFLAMHGIDADVLIVANTLLFLANFIALLIQRKALKNTNPNVFVRGMMGSMMIKMFVLLGAFIAYVIFMGKAVNKPAVYISVFLYFLYLGIEVAIVMKLNKQKNA